MQWLERQFVFCSITHRNAQCDALLTRLQRAENQLEALAKQARGGKGIPKDTITVEQVKQKAEAILKKQRVNALIDLQCQENSQERVVRQYRDKPAHTLQCSWVEFSFSRNEHALSCALREAGWRFYVSNAPPERLSLLDAITLYRLQPRIERCFGRLKGHPLSLTPIYLQRDDHIKGLIRLLTLALQVICPMEFIARETLAEKKETIAGLYAGSPTRSTPTPTAEAMLKAMENIDLSIIQIGDETIYRMSALSLTQRRILDLLGIDESVYLSLAAQSDIPP